jgi:hypothetical protein
MLRTLLNGGEMITEEMQELDAASASAIEDRIEETQRRAWFLGER